MTNTENTFQECIIVVDYAPIRPAHEALILSGFDEHRPYGTVVESEFVDGSFTVYVESDGYPNEEAVREAVKATVQDVFGTVGVSKAQLGVAWEGEHTLPAIVRSVSQVLPAGADAKVSA